MSRLLFLTLILWGLLFGHLWAQYYQMALRELRLVKGASLLAEGFEEAPWPTNVITAEEIERFGWFNLRDLLEYQPSFYLIQDVNERVIAHRGIFRTNTSHLLFLEEGFDLSIPEFRAFMGDASYPLYGISRVEIVRGPGASLYGDAAFTGVVNFERQNIPKPLGIRMGIGDHDREEADLGFHLEESRLGKISTVIHYADLEGELYHDPEGDQLLHPRPRNYALNLRWERAPLSFFYFRMFSRYETPRAQSGVLLSPSDLSPFGSYEKVWQDILGLRYCFSWHHFRFEVRPYLRYFKADTPQVKRTHAEGNFTALDIDLLARATGLEGLIRYPHQQGDFLIGFKWEREDFERNRIRVFTVEGLSEVRYPEKTEDNWAIFAQEKRALRPGLIFNLGLRYDHYQSFGGKFSPRLALIWKPHQRFTATLAWGEAFQAPSYFYRQTNLYGYGTVKELEAEKARTLSFSLLRRFDRNSFVRLTLFREDFRNLLSYDARHKVYENVGELDLHGIELEARYFTERLIAFFNYSFYDVLEVEKVTRSQGDRLFYLPRWMFKGGLSLRLCTNPEVFLSPQFRFYGRTLSSTGRLSPYAIWDLNLLVRKDPFRMSFKFENLFDKHYFRGGTVPPYPWPGRTFMFRLEVDF